jgi:predicted adenine nucleotide alpha hydrolase (AANH) superfamily ATPase
MKFTEKQTELLRAVEKAFFNGDEIVVNGEYAEHSLRTAKSLEKNGWISLIKTEYDDIQAYFNSDQYADWLAINNN